MAKKREILERFGDRVRKLRSEKEFSQEAFALECGLDRTYVSGVERGKRNVSLRNIEVISRALDVSLSELFRDI